MRPSSRRRRIRTPDQRLRVFVSSTLGELAQERRAVQEAIEQLRLSAVMFELGARPHPPRALYRSYLEQSDIFLGIYWQRYGWVAPDMEISGLEDEFRLSGAMPRLVYLKRPAEDMEPRLAQMLQHLQEEDSTSYKPFRDASELRELVLDDLALMLAESFGDDPQPSPSHEPVTTGHPGVPASRFVGREDLVRDLRRTLTRTDDRLVTLSGPGGAGKTRLALEAVSGLEPVSDGTVWVDLSAERDPAQVWAAVVRALPTPGQSDLPALDSAAHWVGRRRLLLVLDNFEQVSAAAPDVARLVESCPRLTVLVTSREALRVRGEVLVPVPPLALPDPGSVDPGAHRSSEAVQLFVDRASSAVPGFALSDAEVADAVALCRRLDGLPLGIELAAARMSVFSVGELRARLEASLEGLGAGPRDLPDRQRTLRATLAWSTSLLPDTERAALAALSCFAGARLGDIESVLARVPDLAEVDAVECVASLVDKNLLRTTVVAGRPWFAMLETVRDHATTLLDADPVVAARVRAAHAEHFGEVAGLWRTHLTARDRPEVMEEVTGQHANLRAAWSHWVSAGDLPRLNDLLELLWGYYDSRGAYREAVALGDDLLGVLALRPADAQRVRDEIAMQASLARSMIAVRGYTADVERAILDALERAGGVDDLPRRFSTLRALGTLHLLRADLPRSREISTELVGIAEELDDPTLLTDAHQLAGITAMSVDVTRGLAHLETAIEQFESDASPSMSFRVGPHPGIVSLVISGLLLWMTGFPDSARRRVERGLELSEARGHPYTTAYALFHASLLALWQQDMPRVADLAQRLRTVAETHDYPVWRALALVIGGTATIAGGSRTEGLARVEEGVTLYRGLSAPPIFWSGLLTIRAIGCLLAGDPDRAGRLLDEAAGAAWEGDPELADIERWRGEVLLAGAEPDLEGAARHFERAAALADELGTTMSGLEALTRLVVVRRGTDAESGARVALLEVYGELREGRDCAPVVTAREVLDAE